MSKISIRGIELKEGEEYGAKLKNGRANLVTVKDGNIVTVADGEEIKADEILRVSDRRRGFYPDGIEYSDEVGKYVAVSICEDDLDELMIHRMEENAHVFGHIDGLSVNTSSGEDTVDREVFIYSSDNVPELVYGMQELLWSCKDNPEECNYDEDAIYKLDAITEMLKHFIGYELVLIVAVLKFNEIVLENQPEEVLKQAGKLMDTDPE